MTSTASKPVRRPKAAAAGVKRSVMRPRPAKSQPRIDPLFDMSAADAFHKLTPHERRRRLEAFRAALAPAFADYSSEDFRADQRREAERDNGT